MDAADAKHPLISVQGLTARYGGATILEDVTFDVAARDILVILGGSGCGKSTLLKHMIGLYHPAQGRVVIGGRDLTAAEGPERLEILRHFGVTYQSSALFGSMTLGENVRLPMEEFTDLPLPAMDLIARMKLKLVGLEDFVNHMPAEISGGMKKRAAIARAMALDPEILFLDEPAAGLDPISIAELDQLILDLRKQLGITFVIVTHELPSIFTIADRVVFLEKEAKGIVAMGAPAELRDRAEQPSVRRFLSRSLEASASD